MYHAQFRKILGGTSCFISPMDTIRYMYCNKVVYILKTRWTLCVIGNLDTRQYIVLQTLDGTCILNKMGIWQDCNISQMDTRQYMYCKPDGHKAVHVLYARWTLGGTCIVSQKDTRLYMYCKPDGY